MTTVLEPGTQHQTDAALTIHPLQPTIGAKISGVDLREPLSPAVRDQIKAAVLEYKVVFFRNQELDRDQHAAFAAQFGLALHPPQREQAVRGEGTGASSDFGGPAGTRR